MHVRRRDVADIFLGTGLGGRAYAIIEQGMISRIVEARPEELRTFLEEAAGISKYRERRKETEQRLEDTRENLARVDDILQELTKQLDPPGGAGRSRGRATARWRRASSCTQHLLWLLRKQEAAASRTRLQRELEQVAIELEAETARLRELESQVEELRVAHYAASDTVHAAQGAMYEANAEAARLEQSLQHLRDSRRRVDNQIAAVSQERDGGDPPARRPADRVGTSSAPSWNGRRAARSSAASRSAWRRSSCLPPSRCSPRRAARSSG